LRKEWGRESHDIGKKQVKSGAKKKSMIRKRPRRRKKTKKTKDQHRDPTGIKGKKKKRGWGD